MADRSSGVLTVGKASRMADAQLIFGRDRESSVVNEVALDSRKVVPGNLFVALKGERTDGHRFLADAVRKGASALMVLREFAGDDAGSRELEDLQVPVLAVHDTLKALQRLAKRWLEGFPGLVRIGVTGSNGKTTTKELIASVLSKVGDTVKNPGNLNSEIGLPQAVLSVKPHHRFAVFEMGINHPGEMEVLADILKPQYGVITTIGTAHIGLLGSREAIAAEKGKVLSVLPKDGRAFVPEDTEWYGYIESISGAPLLSYGRESNEGVEKIEDLGFSGWRIRYEKTDIRLPLMGGHNLANALAAIRIGRFLGAEPEQMAEGIESVVLPEGRSRFVRGGVTIFEDSYNANPDSMQAVIGEVAGRTGRDGLVLVLGAMKELGDEAEKAHRELGEAALRSEAKAIFLLGEETKWTEEALRDGGYGGHLFRSDDFEELETDLMRTVRGGDTLLLKGSRVMELERLVEPLRAIS